ncbi:uncharacterized protein PHACADRAFT_265919, partial [Phanerochaete carnosa HHB-10118-sp]
IVSPPVRNSAPKTCANEFFILSVSNASLCRNRANPPLPPSSPPEYDRPTNRVSVLPLRNTFGTSYTFELDDRPFSIPQPAAPASAMAQYPAA